MRLRSTQGVHASYFGTTIQDDVRRIALTLPEVSEETDRQTRVTRQR
jgi:hypothetical protein